MVELVHTWDLNTLRCLYPSTRYKPCMGERDNVIMLLYLYVCRYHAWCIYVCTQVCIHIDINVGRHTSICRYEHMCACRQTCINIHVNMCACIIYVCMHGGMNPYVCMSLGNHAQIYICIYVSKYRIGHMHITDELGSLSASCFIDDNTFMAYRWMQQA